MGHKNVEWLGKCGASEQLKASDIKSIPAEVIVDNRDTEEGQHTAEGAITELTSLVDCHEFLAEIFSALLVELSVEDTVGLRYVEGVRDVLIHFYSYYLLINQLIIIQSKKK